jgi:RNA polymerase sigma-70 factor (ECF subfamily)
MEVSTEQVYREYYGSVLNYVNMKINNIKDAEDITHDVFQKAHKLIATYSEQRGAISTWIYKIAYTGIIDYLRMNKQDKYIPVSNFVNKDGDAAFQFEAPQKTDKIVENLELNERIRLAFRELKPEYRRVATLYFVNEFKYEEIAGILKMKIGTVKGMISRSREMLKNELSDVHKAETV